MRTFEDAYENYFNDEEELSLNLYNQENESEWLTVCFKDIKFVDCSASDFSAEEYKTKYNVDSSIDAIQDAVNETGFFITINDKGYLLSSQAKIDIISKLGATSSAFSKLSIKDQILVLNKFKTIFADKYIKVVSFSEKIRAILSSNYSKVNNMEAFEAVTEYLDESFPNSIFDGGKLSHDVVSAEWILNDKKLSEAYTERVKETFDLLRSAEPAFEFVNSVTGRSALQIKAFIKTEDASLHLGTTSKMIHKGTTNIDAFKTEVRTAYSSMFKSIEKIEKLKDIKISYPESALINLCNRFHLSKKSLDRIMPIYSAITATNGNALAVWYGLNQVIADMKNFSKMSSVNLFNFEEQIAKVLNPRFDWEKFDYPIEVTPIAESAE